MKINIFELYANVKSEMTFEKEIIFNKEEYQKAGIIELKQTKVTGKIKRILDSYEVDYKITGIMVMACSISLEEIDYNFECEDSIIIEENGQNNELINKNTIDLTEIMWQNIIMEIPLKVEKPGIDKSQFKGEGWKLISQDDSDTSEEFN